MISSSEVGMRPDAKSSRTFVPRRITFAVAAPGCPPESPRPAGTRTPAANVLQTPGSIGSLCGIVPNSTAAPPRKRPAPAPSRSSRR